MIGRTPARFKMRHSVKLLIAAVFLLSGCIPISYQITRRGIGKSGIGADAVIIEPDSRLPDNETLEYKVRWLGMSVGTLRLSLRGNEVFQGRPVYILQAVMKTNDFCSKIYKIDDRYVSYLDADKLVPLRHEVYRREGGYKKDAVTDFDQQANKAYFRNLIDKSEKSFDIPPAVQDILSAYYYFSLLPLKVGDKVEYSVCNNEQNYQFVGVIMYKVLIKVLTLDKEPRPAFLLQPFARLNGKKVDKGNVSVYFSCDKRRLPLFAVVKGPVFSRITLSLSKE